MSVSAQEYRPSSVELEVRRIHELLQNRRYADAAQAAEALAEQVPENRDVLLLIAISQRYLQRIPEALKALERLEQHHPGFSRLYQERGHCYVAQRDAPRAIESYLRGVNMNPALPSSWSMLEGLYRMTGDVAHAKMAADHVATLKHLPPEVVHATSLYSDGELTLAERIVRDYLLKHGNHIEAMRLLAKIGIERDVLDDAEVLLKAVLDLAPDYRAARQDYALVLIERHKYEAARAELEKLLKLDPKNWQFRTNYATAAVGLGEHERALVIPATARRGSGRGRRPAVGRPLPENPRPAGGGD